MKVAQLDRYCRGWRGRKYAKRLLAKARRRAERRNVEDAGSRIRDYTIGWCS